MNRSWYESQLASGRLAIQTASPVHRLESFFLNPNEKIGTCGDVVNQTNDLASGPNLCNVKLENSQVRTLHVQKKLTP